MMDLRRDTGLRVAFIVGLVALLVGSWASVLPLPAWATVGLAALAAFEATVTYRMTQQHGTVRYLRFAEVVLAAIVAEVVALLFIAGSGLSWSQLLLDPRALGLLAIMWLAWLWSRACLVDLDQAGAVTGDQGGYGITRLGVRLKTGMVVALAGAALTLMPADVLVDLDRGPAGGVVPSAVGYIGGAWWMLTQARLAHLRESWRRNAMAAEDELPARWTGLGLWLVAGAALLAWLLPNGAAVLSRVPALALASLGRVGDWLLQWLGRRETDRSRPPREIADRSARGLFGDGGDGDVLPADPDAGSALIGQVGDVLVWLVTILAVTLAIATVVRERRAIREAVRAARSGSPWQVIKAIGAALLATLRSLFGWLRQRWQRSTTSEPTEAAGRPEAVPRPWTPRDPYRSAVARAYHRFLGIMQPVAGRRAESDTPYEYARGAIRSAPAASGDVDALTALYVEARWSDHGPDDAAATRAKHHVSSIERALRNPPPDEPDASQ